MTREEFTDAVELLTEWGTQSDLGLLAHDEKQRETIEALKSEVAAWRVRVRILKAKLEKLGAALE